MSRVADVDPALVAILHDAASWRLLSRLFQCPSAAWRADVARLADELPGTPLADIARRALDEGSEGLYHSMFGPGGPAPPREVSYHDTLELGSVMSSITGAYRAFGYEPGADDPPDHVSVESGFLAFLGLKHAYAMIEGDEGHVEVTVSAAHAFRTGHLAVYAERLAAILADAPADYLQSAGQMLAERVGPRPGPRRLPIIQADDADDGGEFGCDL